MGCSCIIDVDVDDLSEILFEEVVNARKEHCCHECFTTIKQGDEYYKEKSLYNGHISIHKTCMDCKSIRDNLVGSFYWGEIMEAVRDGIHDSGGEVPEDCLSKLTPKARERICGVIESTWDNDNDL
jgi:hypothetical protein